MSVLDSLAEQDSFVWCLGGCPLLVDQLIVSFSVVGVVAVVEECEGVYL